MLESQHRYFPVNIVKFLRTPILKKISEWLLLNINIKRASTVESTLPVDAVVDTVVDTVDTIVDTVDKTLPVDVKTTTDVNLPSPNHKKTPGYFKQYFKKILFDCRTNLTHSDVPCNCCQPHPAPCIKP